mgnify:CR=1 FL=1
MANFRIPQQPGGSYAYSQFSNTKDKSLYIELTKPDGSITSLPLIAFSSTFSLNEIPQATCTVGVGRDATSDNASKLAPIHQAFNWQRMQPAKIYFNPYGNVTKDEMWPDKPFVIFDGYVTALRRSKSFGKYQIEMTLVHWLFDLACSSALSGNSHVANPGDLTEAAVYDTGANTAGNYTSSALGPISAIINDLLPIDLWGTLKSVFSVYAQTETRPINNMLTGCLDDIGYTRNERALAALKRIEGPDWSESSATNKEYNFGSPLVFDFLEMTEPLLNGISDAINNELVRNYAESSFWTKLVTQLCPSFGLAVVPMIDSALVIADVPMFAARQPYKTLKPEDYDTEVSAGSMERPLSGVIVVSTAAAATGYDSDIKQDTSTAIGCYAAKIQNSDGVIMYVGIPPWLNFIPQQERIDPNLSGTGSVKSTRDIYDRWAKDVYVRNALRGRTQTVSGRLRFDVAPGSIIKIGSSRESVPLDLFGVGQALFMDKASFNTYGQVARVSVYINTEAPAAGTSFLLTNVMTEQEYLGTNPENVYSVTSPAIFSETSVHGNGLHGAPLSTEFR